MADIKEYICNYLNDTGFTQELVDSQGLKFPEAYLYADPMCDAALAVRQQLGMSYCILPFCHTVEADAMGGKIKYGDAVTGPRTSGFICETVEDLQKLSDIDFSRGRILEVLKACRMLRERGENVVLLITGPFTALNALLDARYLFRAFRKQPDEMKTVMAYVERNLINFVREALKYGVNYLSYADPVGGVSIVGPKQAEETVWDFTYPLMKKMESLLGDDAVMALCPRTTFALIGTGAASWGKLDLGGEMSYSEALVEAMGKARLIGETCIKNSDYKIPNGILKTIVLK